MFNQHRHYCLFRENPAIKIHKDLHRLLYANRMKLYRTKLPFHFLLIYSRAINAALQIGRIVVTVLIQHLHTNINTCTCK